jgi:hypothetical protein
VALVLAAPGLGLLIWRISRLDLALAPMHPDQAGGLGGFGVAHVDLAPLAFGGSAMLTATYAESVMFAGAKLQSYVLPLTGAVAGNTLMLVAPLVLFAPQLLKAKQRGLLEYGALAADYAHAFDEKWIRGRAPEGESILGTADVQSLADLANSFGVIRSMRIVPIAFHQVVLLVAASVLPMAPLVLFLWPLEELILRGVRTILNP